MPTTKWAELNENGLVLCKADQAVEVGLRLGIAEGAPQAALVLKSGATDQTAYLVAKVATADAATGDEIASAKFVGDKVAVLIEAVKDLAARNQAHERRIAALESELKSALARGE